MLPTQGIAERYDIVVDFSKYGIKPGDKLFFVNLMHHDDGKGPKEAHPAGGHPVGEVPAGAEAPSDGKQQWDKGDPAVGKFMQLRVKAYTGRTRAWTRSLRTGQAGQGRRASDDPAVDGPRQPGRHGQAGQRAPPHLRLRPLRRHRR
jgi:hypothetical protein